MSESALGVYLYCIVPPGSQPELDGITGVDGRAPVEEIATDQLTAIVSRVPLDEFGPEALKRNLEDLEWLERTARVHDSVLAAMMAADAVVPMRL
ncbi:MAG TPA: GvpL/GvpF family gas vesicle protein, partial [Candidatus Sulfotelmatobacter sp.]|nr:GvpL/GvpF family gas vesicle protein [Candidatus Sulfotelmatobacter sp.]